MAIAFVLVFFASRTWKSFLVSWGFFIIKHRAVESEGVCRNVTELVKGFTEEDKNTDTELQPYIRDGVTQLVI